MSLNKIKFEIGEIDRFLNEVEALLILSRNRELDLIETMASATVQNSFYNGIERIFLIIAKEIDGKVPGGDRWHKELLIQMNSAEGRHAVLSDESMVKINEYMVFRHYFRHAYSCRLKWEEMKDLVIGMDLFWSELKVELNLFIREHFNEK